MDDTIHTPGEWLDDDLTERESEEIIAFAELSNKLKSEHKTGEEIMEQLAPYMNSFMHLFYRLNKERAGIHATPDGVKNEKGEDFDIVAFTLDFVEYSIIDHNPVVAAMQEVRLPDETAYPIDRVTRMFFQNQFEVDKPVRVKSGDFVKQDGKKKKAVIAPTITISLLDPPVGIEFSRDIEPFDNEVFRAVCSLQEMGNKQFTGNDIYRVMTHNRKAIATPDTLRRIDISWKRMTSTAMRLDTGNVGDGYNFMRWIRNQRIIEGRDETMMVKNQHGLFESTIYVLLEEPILKTYAAQLNQIGRYPIEWLKTPVNKTPELMILQTAIFDHIQAIPEISNHILYDTIFERIELPKEPNARRQKKMKLRNQIHKILNYWKEKGVIHNWNELRKNNSVYCIVIEKTAPAELPQPEEPKGGLKKQ